MENCDFAYLQFVWQLDSIGYFLSLLEAHFVEYEGQRKPPSVYIIAGSNGAGKTTFAREFLLEQVNCKEFVNADFLAQGFSPLAPELATIKAGRFTLERIRELSEMKKDFAFETTLSGKTYLQALKKLKAKGYAIHLYFLWIPNVEIVLKRIAERVRRGGHDIPKIDVRRRFKQGILNLFTLYEPLLDFWTLLDNSVFPPTIIASKREGEFSIHNQKLYNKIKEESMKHDA